MPPFNAGSGTPGIPDDERRKPPRPAEELLSPAASAERASERDQLPPTQSRPPVGGGQSPEELQSELMGRTTVPRMSAADVEAATLGTAAQIGGAGMGALGGMAAGAIGAGMQGQHEATLRAIQAQRAGSRGPVGLAEYGATQATGLAGAQLAGEAGKLQLQAAQAEAGFQAKQADLNQAITTMQGQFQQQANMSNAEMEQKAREINLSVEADLMKERDRLIAEYAKMGLAEEQYQAELAAALERLKTQLTHDYWKADLEADTAALVTVMQEEDAEDYYADRVKSRTTTPGYSPSGKLSGDYWATPEYRADQAAAAEAANAANAEENTYTPNERHSEFNGTQEEWDAMSDAEKRRYYEEFNTAQAAAESGPEDYNYYSGDRVMSNDELSGMAPPSAYETFREQTQLAPPAGVDPTVRMSLGRETEKRVSDLRAGENRQAAVQSYLGKPDVGPPTVMQQAGKDFSEADQIAEESRKSVADQLQYLDYTRKGIGAGVAAYQIGTAKNAQEREAAIVNLVKSEGVSGGIAKAAEMATSKWGESAGGAVTAAGKVAYDVGSEMARPDDKRTSKSERVQHAATRGATVAGGGWAGAEAGGIIGGLASTALNPTPTAVGTTPLGVGIGSAIGGTLGALGAGEAYDAAIPAPGVRTTNPQEMIGGALAKASPTVLRSDPMSVMRDRPEDVNRAPFADDYARRQDKAFVGGPEDMAMPPEMTANGGPPPPMVPDELEMAKSEMLPANESYDFLESLSGGAPGEAPPEGEIVDSQALAALGDLHDRLKEIESMMGAGAI